MSLNKNFDNLSHHPLWTALITPFNAQGDVDFESLSIIATEQADAGNGLLLLGSTGEGLALSADEQVCVIEFVSLLQLQVPLMVAVGGYNLTTQEDLIRHCNNLPIDAYLLGTPIYAKPGPVGQTQWFSRLLDAAAFPCMLYNVPSRSGISIPISTLQQLQKHPNCWALKEASGDLNQFLAYRQHCPEIALYSGEDAMMPYLVNAGVKGLVSVCANAWPEATRHYVELSLQGQTHSLFPLWQNAVDALFQVANPIPVKVLMHEQQVINTPVLRPPLTHQELAANNSLIEADEKITQWLAQRQWHQNVGE